MPWAGVRWDVMHFGSKKKQYNIQTIWVIESKRCCDGKQTGAAPSTAVLAAAGRRHASMGPRPPAALRAGGGAWPALGGSCCKQKEGGNVNTEPRRERVACHAQQSY
jgi:hypothetical protein